MLMNNQLKHWSRSAAARWQGQGAAGGFLRCGDRSRCSRCRTHNPSTPRQGRRRHNSHPRHKRYCCTSLCRGQSGAVPVEAVRAAGRSRCSRCRTHNPSTPRRARRRRMSRQMNSRRSRRTAYRGSAEGGREVRPVLSFWLGRNCLSRTHFES